MNIPVLGHNIWWGLKGVKVTRFDLENALKRYGFADYMPEPPTAQKALRRAIKDWVKLRAASGTGAVLSGDFDDDEDTGTKKIRSLIRPINKRGNKHLVFALVAEEVNFQILGLEHTTSLRIALEKLTPEERKTRRPDLTCTTESEGNIEAAREAYSITRELLPIWQQYEDLYLSGDLSRMATEIVNAIRAIPIRREGGLYFVPASNQAQAERMRDLIEGLPNDGTAAPYCMLLMVPDEQAAKKELGRAVFMGFMDQIKAMNADLEDLRAKAKTIKPDTIAARLKEFKEFSQRAEAYADLLSLQNEQLQNQISSLRSKARALIMSDDLPDELPNAEMSVSAVGEGRIEVSREEYQ
jgi:hypothetical protein